MCNVHRYAAVIWYNLITMTFGGRKAMTTLFLGDLAVLALSLWLTLVVRFGEIPSSQILGPYLVPFGILFAFWMLIFYMGGLYGKNATLFHSKLLGAVLRTQLFNIVCAALLFFFVPIFGITPKTILFIYFIVSLLLIFFWRLFLFPRITQPSVRYRAAIIGTGDEVHELVHEVNCNTRYGVSFPLVIDPTALTQDVGGIEQRLVAENISVLVVDSEHKAAQPFLPLVYQLAFVEQRYQYADFYRMYEEVFDRVPLSILRFEWFLKNISRPSSSLTSIVKRSVDIVGGTLMGVTTLFVLPFVYIAMRLEGKGPLFLVQERFGQYGTRMSAYKFRTMRYDDSASSTWVAENKDNNYVTRVGTFLRKTSLDEFPQFINILRGELSLIGPRNDIAGLGSRLAEELPFYMVRYVVKPGLTGWAQINQRYEPGNISPQSIEETKVRLAYDFYYVKNRSLALDLVIALKTIKRMLFRVSAI